MSAATPDIGSARRAAARARWERLGWPTSRSEAWRNFSTRPLQGFALEGGIAPGAGALPALPEARVVFADGRYLAEHTALGALAGRVEVHALEPALGDRLDRLVPEDGALEALNTAFLSAGVLVRVPAGVEAGTLNLVHLVTGAGTAHVRTVVVLERGASLTLAQHHVGRSDGAYFVNLVTEVELAEGARLALGKCVEEGPAGVHLEALHARVGKDGALATYTLSASGERVRTAITATLAGPGASASVDGLYLGRGRATLDHVTDIRHAVGDTRSAETWAGVLDDRSEGGFQGVVRIAEGAARASTRQLTRTLLLSNEAQAHAKPELHIDCDDVQASHGATVGQLDPLEQFYLESRGIAPEDARRMLIRAFVEKQLALAPASLSAMFEGAVARALGGGPMVIGGDDQEAGDGA